MIVGILQPSYLPWLGYFDQIYHADTFVLYDDVQFDKGGWRNRNRIKTSQGVQWLTVPVLKKRNRFVLIKDIRINGNVSWQKKHIKALSQNYCKTAFYRHYSYQLYEILNRDWRFLIDLNLEIISWFCQTLMIDTRLIRSSELGIAGRGNQRLVDIINALGSNVFFEGSSGKNYIDEQAFTEAGISIQYQDYIHPVYRQQYGKFIPYLSAIDLIFNHGPNSLNIIVNGEK
ncbi:MAG: WbqC family protein [Desulfobacterales bacterium]|jgi:hypothetical protein|nr:WbqC family protein [Desulfobacterales bacterium]MDP6806697.1 WbqC family protein [Desulfobacterales bacterium]|tara:strand:+ start:6839 stop:7528 length:690 start_codon:yes stop_codon:yes gene_type:complete